MGNAGLDQFSGGILGLVASASPMAKVVIGILFVFSVLSWAIMLVKLRQYGRTEKQGERFFEAVRETDSFKKLLTVYKERGYDNTFYKLMLVTYKERSARQKDNPRLEAETVPLI